MSRDKYSILFVSINSVWRYGNIGMDQLLGFLRNKGFNIEIKYFRSRESAEQIFDVINKKKYNSVCFSVNISNYQKCVDLSKRVKETSYNTTIVFGGGYPTRYYREIIDEVGDLVDYMILGDGEYPSEYLFDCLIQNENGANVEIKNDAIATPDDYIGKKDYFNTEITWEPAYDYYEKDNNHINSRKVHCIQIKNNICTGNCSFCTERHGKVVYKNIESVVNQIEYVNKTFGVEKIFFTDDNILDPNNEEAKEHLIKLCQEIEKRDLRVSYQCYIKAFSLRDTPRDNELLNLMRKVGFVEIFIGIESGNQDDLDLYNKKTTVEENYEIVKLLKKHDIFPIYGYIAFNPYSSRKSIKDNFDFLVSTECTYLHNYIYSFTVINKYTALYEKIKEEKLLLSDENEYVDVKFKFLNDDVVEVLEYVKNKMIPKLGQLDYELDWVTYSVMEHEICYPEKMQGYREKMNKQKKRDIKWIQEHLKLLFVDFDVCAFEKVEDEFWDYFKKEEELLKSTYDYIIKLHYE